MEKLEIVKKFKIEGNVISLERYGCGHINETYLLKTNKKDYIFQKINNHIFKDVAGLMNNIRLVLEFSKQSLTNSGGDPTREAMTLVLTKDNETYFHDIEDDSYYRIYDFVIDSLAIQSASSKEEFAESGKAFGKFQKLLAEFDASQLVEVIPNFHNTEVRYEHFIKTLEADAYDRAKYCKEEIEFVLNHKEDCKRIVNLIKENKIPLKVTHNDTKLNNVLFDNKTHKSLCVIDLDTIMPGSSLYDFGDSIRFGCNTVAEDEKDLSKLDLNLEYFEAFAASYLSEVKDSLNNYEIDNLAFGAKLMTLECGIRFLDDYLDGNKYFATKYDEHNLVRCRTQFKLVRLMEENMMTMNEIIHRLAK